MIKSLIRVLTFFGKWAAELVSQPALILSLVVGPFFILLTFGTGLQATPPEPDVIVVSDDPGERDDEIMREVNNRFDVTMVTQDLPLARSMLYRREVDAVLVLPTDPEGSFERGAHAEVLVLTNVVDPAQEGFTRAYLTNQLLGLNQLTTELMVREAQQDTQETRDSIEEARTYTSQVRTWAGGQASNDLDRLEQELDRSAQLVDQFNRVPPELVSSPFELEVQNIAGFNPSFTAFYGPAVLVLLLQHLAVTMGALTLTRVRLLGVMDLLRVSPVKPMEMVAGHYLSYAVLCGLAGAALTALLVYALGVPLLGSIGLFVAVIGLLTLCSLGIGFIIASISSSEQQSAQVAMLVLLTSIFFAGLVFPLGQIVWPARTISYLLPATYGIRSSQDVMLRGDLHMVTDLAVLGGAAVVLFLVTVLLIRREWRPD